MVEEDLAELEAGAFTTRLTPITTLEGFDFTLQPLLNRHRILALAQLKLVERAEVVHLLGPPGSARLTS